MSNKISFISVIFCLLLLVATCQASSVTRTFSKTNVIGGEVITVYLTVTKTGVETFYAIDETYPFGWIVTSTLGDTSQAGHVKFVVQQGASSTNQTYSIRAPASLGVYSFSGIYMFEGTTSESVIPGQAQVLVGGLSDTIPPNIAFVFPTPNNNTIIPSNYIQVNVSLSEAPGTCTLNWFSGSWANSSMLINGLSCYLNMTALSNSTYQFRVYASDLSGNMNVSAMRQNSVAYSSPDTTPPSITFVSPTPNNSTSVASNYMVINVSLSETPDVCTLNWFSSGTWANYTMIKSGASCYLNMTGLTNSVYQFRVYAADISGNLNVSSIRQNTVSYSPPCVLQSANLALNDANSNGLADIGETIIMSGATAGNCTTAKFYQIDAGSADQTCNIEYNTPPGNITGITNGSGLIIGGSSVSGTWRITWIPDVCSFKSVLPKAAALYSPGPPPTGLMSMLLSSLSGSFTFAGGIPPSISFVSPTPNNSSTIPSNYIEANVSLSETPGTCTLNWYNGSWWNLSMSITGQSCYANMTILSNSTYQFRVYASDLSGNMNVSPMRQNSVAYSPSDLILPSISFVAPTPANNMNSSENYIQVNISLSETPGICTLNWYNGTWVNSSMSVSGMSCYINMTNLANYTYQFMVYASDLSSNINVSATRQNMVNYSTTEIPLPDITFVSPTPNNIATIPSNYIQINVSLSEEPGTCTLNWYDGSWANLSMSVTEMSCYLNMTALSNYTYQFRVYASDLSGHMNVSEARQNVVQYSFTLPNPYCGDGSCNGGETCSNCSLDCGQCCGNSFCEPVYGESCLSCSRDCGPCLCPLGQSICSDGVCGVNCSVIGNVTPAPVCTDGQVRSCSLTHEGYCAIGNETCTNGAWNGCPTLISEICNNVDDNCDGQIDEGLNCECLEGQTRPCGSDIGECRKGIQTCISGKWASACYGEVKPTAEICNGADDNCDGTVDDNCTEQLNFKPCPDGIISTKGCICQEKIYTTGFCYGNTYYEDFALKDYTEPIFWTIILLIFSAIIVRWRHRKLKAQFRA